MPRLGPKVLAVSRGSGGAAVPARYAEWCDRIDVVRDLAGLDRAAYAMMAGDAPG